VKQATSWDTEFTDGRSTVARRSAAAATGDAVPSGAEATSRAVPAYVTDRDADRALGLGQAVLRGSLIGFAVVAAIVWVVAHLAGYGTTPALGVAAFAGLWGGPGFGGMMGATLAANRAD
jgi:hypothetical protein